MKTVKINNVEVQVVEHMKEIKDVCDNAILFKKWYNRNQMFKALLGNFIFNGKSDDSEECGEYGTCLGSIVKSAADCWYIELYRAEDIEESTFKELVEWQVEMLHTAFFIEDSNGTVYLVCTGID